MKKKPRKPLTDKDGEVRELTRADYREFRPAKEVLPPHAYEMMMNRKRTALPKPAAKSED